MRMRLAGLAAIAVLAPVVAQAEQPAKSFDQLQQHLKPDQLILVVDRTGHTTYGRVADTSPTSLSIITFERATTRMGGVVWTRGQTRTLAQDEVAVIQETDAMGTPKSEIYRGPGSFGDLQRKLRVGQTAIVVDRSGYHVQGRVVAVSPSALVVNVGGLAAPQTFTADAVTAVKRPGPIWDGAIKGFAVAEVATLVVLGQYADDYPGVFLTTGGIGAAIGVGIDALWGPKEIYRAPRRPRVVSVSPIVRPDRQGLRATIRF